jgi:endoglucanase
MITSRWILPALFLLSLNLANCSKGSPPDPSGNGGNTAPTTNNTNNSAPSRGWLSTSGNQILGPGGAVWVGRGANLHDTRSCGLTTDAGAPLADSPEGLAEVKRRIDTLTEWKANFIRLALESRRTQDNYLSDANYRALVKEIVDYIGTKPGVYVLVSLWIDPSFDPKGSPTAATNAVLEQLAKDFYNYDYVMFGVSNEPEENFDGAQDAEVWAKMNAAVAAIRGAEAALGTNRHLIAVQGTRDWARVLDYYVTHPITAGGGTNVVYETHIYNAPGEYDALFVNPGKTLPVILGEFGPINDEFHKATLADVQTLMDKAKAAKIPHLAWTFHQFCPPNLIGDKPGMTWEQNFTGDGLAMTHNPTDFGILLKNNLAQP